MKPHARIPACPISQRIILLIVLLLAAISQNTAWAAISLNATRVIIDQKTQEAHIRILNEGLSPVLIQTWTDAGDTTIPLENLQTPFVIVPPFFRLEPQATQQLRIISTQPENTLPADRESLFWLNIQEVPPAPLTQPQENYMQIAFRTRIKVFYRPQAIPFDTESLHQQLTFSITQNNGRFMLQIHNPTPIHVTFLKIDIGSAPRALAQTLESEESMVAPYSTLTIPIQAAIPDPASASMQVRYTYLNDFGVSIEHQVQLTPAP